MVQNNSENKTGDPISTTFRSDCEMTLWLKCPSHLCFLFILFDSKIDFNSAFWDWCDKQNSSILNIFSIQNSSIPRNTKKRVGLLMTVFESVGHGFDGYRTLWYQTILAFWVRSVLINRHQCRKVFGHFCISAERSKTTSDLYNTYAFP